MGWKASDKLYDMNGVPDERGVPNSWRAHGRAKERERDGDFGHGGVTVGVTMLLGVSHSDQVFIKLMYSSVRNPIRVDALCRVIADP